MNSAPGLETRMQKLHDTLMASGQQMAESLAVLVLGMIASKLILKVIRHLLDKTPLKPPMIATICNIFQVLLLVTVVAAALTFAGWDDQIIFRFLVILALVAIGFIMLLRPYIPTMPFKVGNYIKSVGMFGKVEGITMINTRLRTFDGKTVFIPNTKILKDILINYHFTPTRRIYIDVGIGYDQDLMKAKQLLEEIMIADPRVLAKPRPVVYVLSLTDSWVKVGARCWADNLKYWRTKCDLVEKVKFRFDQEGIRIAFPKQDVFLHQEDSAVQAVPEEFA